MKKIFFAITFLFCISKANSQVIISLIFGDKLNSPNLEFGLVGGVNFSDISNLEDSEVASNFNLGFYFDYRIIKNTEWLLNTGVLVISSVGAESLPVYSLGDVNVDNTFTGGFVNREINYFYVPLMMKYKFKNNIYAKGGGQAGLLGKANDIFVNYYNESRIVLENNIRDKIHVVDAGLTAGLGYRIDKGYGMNVELQYYYGLVPLLKGDTSPNQFNRSLYLSVGIPIGKGASKKNKEAKEAAEKASAEQNRATPTQP
ncbi:MAG TPA: porin family protein [Flavobacterium sp.]|jgi:hypothetical protein|nr:porin family protein [Flavobacterium sp.]